MQRYLVGGAVRDQLLGIPSKDRDWVVVGATPEEMLAQGYQQVGADFPVFLHPETKEEHALARTERKSGRGYTGFICDFAPDITLEEDLKRRDLTINAIAMDESGELVDPYNGAEDLKNRVLRHVSDAFAEDPLRVLRVARFAARFHRLGFEIAPETLHLMSTIAASGELEALTAERVWQETQRALGEKSPWIFINVLHDTQALGPLFPELESLFGVPQEEKYHPEVDTGIHLLLCLQEAAKLNVDTDTRFAVLCHDIGKGLTPKEELPRHINHGANGLPTIRALCDRLKTSKSAKELALLVAECHTECHKVLTLEPVSVVKLLDRCDAWRRPERFNLFLLACEADARGRPGWETLPYPQADFLRLALAACKNISPKTLVEKGFKGTKLREQLDMLRIDAVTQIDKASLES
ncbi:multifunctional CCA tRNA nucleotidyl transferase/2'3'-cyclic phosphodiesterase/2'nucleotidase/phosphatase [Hahella sp. CCB-MM4]|uniref:multifunctional CCA addition/repair protein n=1 Tax=Hahella sp. (strain CCB-MM4) TaxID=1926491 RepID=UPI000B9B7F63|nr:multifunctional CCA addition/repair protein [Hahella sp. CCB-MM4]OZG71154.1 multifunctional CCA tRNA nucleotidyl transferase/2'3'-cyclic phosphodiesterase/2'nucleotidase/phosphatase [Hahella sp. CCB-MM4]